MVSLLYHIIMQMSIVLGCVGLIAYALKTAYSFLFIKTSGYELKEKEIVCARGVFFKKTSVLEYSKMHAINKKQNIFQKLFKIAVLTVDSGATHNSNNAEIIIIENDETVDKLVSRLKLLQSGKKADIIEENTVEKENLYTFNSKKVLLYSALNLVSSLAIILILAGLTAVSFAVLKSLLTSVFLISYKNFYLAFLMIAGSCILITVLLSFIISLIASFFTYHNFRLYKNESDIEVNYGLLVRHTNTFKFDKIKGVKISQGIIKRIFGYATVNLEVIGYLNENANNNGGESNIIGVLMPLCKVSEINENLSKILPEYTPNEKEIKAVKYPPFVLWTIGFISIFVGLAYFITLGVMLVVKAYSIVLPLTLILLFAYAVVVAFIMLLGALSYQNSGVAVKEGKITVYGGSIVKTITVINKKHLIGIEEKTTPLRSKAGISTFVFHIKTNALTNEIPVYNISSENATTLKNLLKY